MPPVRTSSVSSTSTTMTATHPHAASPTPSASSPHANTSNNRRIFATVNAPAPPAREVNGSNGTSRNTQSPPMGAQYSPQQKREDSPNASMSAANESSRGEPVKQQKACIHCRKSKVKCVNEGGPPCRRCLDANLDCKFRLRADDENWRERTDETLSKLSDAVDALLHRGLPVSSQPQPPAHHAPPPPPAHPHPHHHHPYAHPSHSMPPPHLPSPRVVAGNGIGGPGGLHASHPAYSPHESHSVHGYPLQPSIIKSSPQSDHSSAYMDYMPRSSPHTAHPPPLPRTMSGPPNVISSINSERSHDAAYYSASSSQPHHRRTSSMRSQDLLAPGVSVGGGPSSPIGAAGAYTPGGGSKHSSNSSANSYTPQPLPPLHHSAVGYNHTPAAGFLRHVTSHSTPFFLTNPLPMRWTSGVAANQSYGAPVAYIGRDDPRLTCISRSLIPLEKVRGLFMFFADKMQPHSFGFPTFPPSEYMTPLIISAISMVSSLHEPSTRQHHAILKADVKAAMPEDEVYEGRDLDPELGIGVEEITAVCIASSWLGGEEAYSLARLARWWALAYLRQFETDTQVSAEGSSSGRAVTLGEALTILPPFRQIDLASKLRIWLESYVVDAHQAFMHEKEPMAPHASPSYYCEALRTTMLSTTGNIPPSSANGGQGLHSAPHHTGPSRLSLHDRQLIGHASLLEILLDAQRIERFHSQFQQQHQQRGQWNGDALRAQEELLSRRLSDLLGQVDAVDRWRERIRKDEDLSAANPTSMDLTFTYLLTRSYIGSLAISLDLSFLVSAAPAIMPFQTPGLFMDFNQPGPSASTAEQDWPHSMMCQQTTLINTAKESALSAIDLACERKGRGFGDRLVAMPTWYHFLLSHVVGFLLQLVQRKHKFLLSREARTILSKVETFVQQYVFEITSHGYLSGEVLAAHGGGVTGSSVEHGNGHGHGHSHSQGHTQHPHSSDGSSVSPPGIVGSASSPSAMSPTGTAAGSGSGTAGAGASSGTAGPATSATPNGATAAATTSTSTHSYFQTPHGASGNQHASSSLIPKNIIPGADHPAKVMAQYMAKAVAHVKAQSKG